MIVEVFQDKAQQWRIRLRADNSKIVLTGESYYQKSNAVRAAKRVRDTARAGAVVLLREGRKTLDVD